MRLKTYRTVTFLFSLVACIFLLYSFLTSNICEPLREEVSFLQTADFYKQAKVNTVSSNNITLKGNKEEIQVTLLSSLPKPNDSIMVLRNNDVLRTDNTCNIFCFFVLLFIATGLLLVVQMIVFWILVESVLVEKELIVDF